MKNYKYILMIFIVFLSCTKKQKGKFREKYHLKGSWKVIDQKDLTYYEAFYNDSTYQYYFGDDDLLTSPRKYKIKADTLFAYTKERKYINFIEEKEDKIFIIEVGKRKARYILIDSSEYTMNKISDEKDFEKFHKAYLSRKYELIKKGIVKKDSW